MKIALCASIRFAKEIGEAAAELTRRGHTAIIPLTARRILNGEISLAEFESKKSKVGDSEFRRSSGVDIIRKHFEEIRDSDAILVLNLSKNGIENYIGGNTFLEMGFAYVLHKKIFLYNRVPEMSYRDEILAMNPTVINGDLGAIS